MAPQSTQSGSLAASSDLEVVYCHACSNRWNRAEGGLICPSCHNDVTEIVTRDNDPPGFGTQDSEPQSPPFQYGDKEGIHGIDDHTGRHGIFLRTTNGLGGQEAGGQTQTQSRFGPPPVYHSTFTSATFRGGASSVIILSGPSRPPPGDDADGATSTGEASAFQAIFDDILRGIGPPTTGDQQLENPGIALELPNILSLFAAANAVAGDAYTQEALGRINTILMEFQPQSDAAPPASAEGLAKLERKTVDEELLKLNEGTDCSICIDEVVLGDTVAFLPCKHWFHEDCVVMWLQEHNTCPVCRTPIEKREANETRRAAAGNSAGVGPSGSLPRGLGQIDSRGPLLNFGLFSPGASRFAESDERTTPTGYAQAPARERSNTPDDAAGTLSGSSFRRRERRRLLTTPSNSTYDRHPHSPAIARHRQRSRLGGGRPASTDYDSGNKSSGRPPSRLRGQ